MNQAMCNADSQIKRHERCRESDDEISAKTNESVKGAISLTVAALIVKVLGAIYKIPIAHIIGEEGMGYFNSAYTVYSVFYLLCTAGVPKAITIILLEKRTELNVKGLVGYLVRVFWVISALMLVLLLFLSAPMASLIGNKNSFLSIIAIAPSIIFVAISGVLRGYLNSSMNLLDVAVSQIIEGVFKLVSGLIFAHVAIVHCSDISIISAAVIFGVTIGSFASYVYLSIISKQRIKKDNIGQKTYDVKILKKVFSYSLPITLSSVIMSISSVIDLGMIINCLMQLGLSTQSATEIYGSYTTSSVSIFNLAISFVTPISLSFLPAFAKYKNSHNLEYLKKPIENSLLMTAFITAPLTLGLYVYAYDCIKILFGESYAEGNVMTLRLLVPCVFFLSLLLITNSLLESLGSMIVPLASMTLGALLKTIVGKILISQSDFGILGAPIGSVILYAIALIVSTIALLKKYKISLPIFKTHALPYLNAFVSVISSYYLRTKFLSELSQTLSFIVAVSVCAVIYLSLSVFSCVLRIDKLKSVKT